MFTHQFFNLVLLCLFITLVCTNHAFCFTSTIQDDETDTDQKLDDFFELKTPMRSDVLFQGFDLVKLIEIPKNTLIPPEEYEGDIQSYITSTEKDVGNALKTISKGIYDLDEDYFYSQLFYLSSLGGIHKTMMDVYYRKNTLGVLEDINSFNKNVLQHTTNSLYEMNLMIIATRVNNLPVIKALVEKGVSLDSHTHSGYYHLYYVYTKGAECVRDYITEKIESISVSTLDDIILANVLDDNYNMIRYIIKQDFYKKHKQKDVLDYTIWTHINTCSSFIMGSDNFIARDILIKEIGYEKTNDNKLDWDFILHERPLCRLKKHFKWLVNKRPLGGNQCYSSGECNG